MGTCIAISTSGMPHYYYNLQNLVCYNMGTLWSGLTSIILPQFTPWYFVHWLWLILNLGKRLACLDKLVKISQ